MIKRRGKSLEDGICRIDRDLNTIYICGDITPALATSFRKLIRSLDKGSEPIQVEINSEGGAIEAGFMMVDSIELCKNTVITRATGSTMSAAASVLLAGDVREALPRSLIMLHQGRYSSQFRYDEAEIEFAEIRRCEKQFEDYIDLRTGRPLGYWQSRAGNKNLYLTPEQAKEEGIIQTIVKGPRKC